MVKPRILCALVAALCSLSLSPALLCAEVPPRAAQGGAETGISLNFKDIELSDLIQTVSELTGKNFLYDETVKGKATIISPATMTMDDAYQLFLTVLNVKGYTVVPSGKINKIVPVRDAKESNLPTVVGDRSRGGDQYVTRLIPLQNIDATDIATTILAPLIPKTSNIVAYPPSNTLIITDSGANIERLMEIISELDIPSSLDVLEVLQLEYAGAEEIAQICTQVITGEAGAAKGRRTARNVKTAGEKAVSKILPYPRTNALIVMASTDDLESIRALIARLDQRPSQERSHINVYYLENADAETLGKTLNEILTGIKTQAKAQNGKSPVKGEQTTPLTTEAVTITSDKPTNSLIINATPEDYEVIKGIVKQLDIQRKQVFVEALILELSMDATKKLGASLQGAVAPGSESLVFGTSNQGTTNLGSLATDSNGVPGLLTQTIDGILLGGLFNLIDVPNPSGEGTIRIPALSALIDLSKTDTDINILSAPRLLTSDNEEAEIIVGSNVPIITQRLTESTNLNTSVSIERKDVALTLRFTPQVTEGDLVRLNVYQEITGISSNSVGNINEVGPTLTKRLLRNTVLAENGKTVVLGGLIGSDIQESITKVPLLGDLPLLGWLFKRKTHSEKKTNLLIFITPRIIKDTKDLAMVTRQTQETMARFKAEQMGSTAVSDAFEQNLLQTTPAPAAPAEELELRIDEQ